VAEAVPFHRPYATGRELARVEEVLRSGHVAGDGEWTRRCQERLVELTGAARALLTGSCTHALEMCALLLGVQPGDEVIVPSFTFVSTVNAFVLRGAVPVFVDIRPDTLNLDERLVEGAITPRTKAIVVMHYAGVACEMDAIGEVAARAGIPVIEDAAHGLGGSYRGRPLGGIGEMGTVSFHETKHVQCGEGGALLLNGGALAQRAEIIREKGTDRARFVRGEVDRYRWVDLGSSYLLAEVLAGILDAQLDAVSEIIGRQRAVWSTYDRELGDWADARGVVRPHVPDHCEHPASSYRLLLADAEERARFIAHLRDAGVAAVSHYEPLHSSPMGRRLAPGAQCPVSEDASRRLVRLPLHAGLTDREVDQVVEAVRSFPG
jgi:dTDP-4-amino-4,6-dideoxygalactose transaminase